MSEKLIIGCYYHIYNRGNHGENIFREERNYRYFLQLYLKYIEPVADTYAYCLLVNHFHLLVRIRLSAEQTSDFLEKSDVSTLDPTEQFRRFFLAYAKAINKAYQRTGALFEHRFKRKLVDNHNYFTYLVAYIHRNPQTHGFADDFRDWPWSSYGAMLSGKETKVQRDDVLEWFGGQEAFIDGHVMAVDETGIEPLIMDDFV
jgi:REP element-mobilizing transposase RayT